MMAKKKRTEQGREGRGREKRRGGAGRAERENTLQDHVLSGLLFQLGPVS